MSRPRRVESVPALAHEIVTHYLTELQDHVTCQRFLDERMRGLTLTHLQFDEQWTYVAKKQSRLTVDQRETCHDKGDIYLWTCIDQETKLMPSFRVGKRTGDNARRFMLDVAARLVWPKPHASDDHAPPDRRDDGRAG